MDNGWIVDSMFQAVISSKENQTAHSESREPVNTLAHDVNLCQSWHASQITLLKRGLHRYSPGCCYVEHYFDFHIQYPMFPPDRRNGILGNWENLTKLWTETISLREKNKLPAQLSPGVPLVSSLPTQYMELNVVQSKKRWFHGSWTARSRFTPVSKEILQTTQ